MKKNFIKFLRNTIFYEPFKVVLKDTLDVELINFLLENFNNYFILHKDLFLKFL